MMKLLLDKVLPELQKIETVGLYQEYVLFSTMNSFYSYFKLDPFKEKLSVVMKLFWKKG